MRALAYWHAIPQEAPSSNPKQPRKQNKQSRMQLLEMKGTDPELPDLASELIPIINMLFEVGPTSAAGEGSVPLTWVDLQAWQSNVGVSYPAWQLRLLRRLSADYLQEYRLAGADDAPPPWVRDMTADRRAKVATNVRNILRG